MDFIRTITHSVRSIRSNVRRTGAGRMADAGPPVITIIKHKPGYWAAYGTQSVISSLLAAAGVYGIVYVAMQRPGGPFGTADLMFAPFVVMVLIGALLPAYFVRQFRQLQRVFDTSDEHLEPTADTTTSTDTTGQAPQGYETDEQITTAALVSGHPNVGLYTDPTWIVAVAGLLFVTSILQFVSGIYLSFTFDGYSSETQIIFDGSETSWLIFGIGQLVQFGVNAVLGVLVTRHHSWSVAVALLLAVLNLVLAAQTGHPFWLILAAVTVLALAAGTIGFRRMHARIADPLKRDALEAYYHNLMLALVQVMRADGRCDRTELHKISRLCNNMNLSTYERDVVMTVGNESAPEPVSQIVDRYLDAARVLKTPEPELGLLLCAYAVAGADGQLVPEEATALEALAQALDVQPSHLVSELSRAQSPEPLTMDRARALLNVTADAPRPDLDAAYLRLSTMVSNLSFDHLGQHLAEVTPGHSAALLRAHELLTAQTPA